MNWLPIRTHRYLGKVYRATPLVRSFEPQDQEHSAATDHGHGIDAYDSDVGGEEEYWQAVYADYLLARHPEQCL
jgi:hypothetical protein